MIIYGSLIIILIVTFIFYVLKSNEYKWWEFFIPFGVTLFIIFISKLIIDYSSVQFTEYWGSNILYIVEEEPYNYWHSEMCSRQVPCGTDKDGNTEYCTEWYDCSHQDDVGPDWYAVTNIRENISISERQHDELVKQFGTKRVITESRENYDSNDKAVRSDETKFENKSVGKISNVLKTSWDFDYRKAKAVFSVHSYENRIKASDLSVFNIKVVNEKQADSLKLYKYPKLKDQLDFPTILGSNISKNIQEKFKRLNGKFGPKNKCRLWILLFKDKPYNIANYQENYWVRGNKNELVICIGINKLNEIQWVHSFSWANSNTLTSEVKQKANELKILNDSTWNVYYNYLNNNLQRFQKRSFKEFDYLTVEPSKGIIIFIYILALLISIGCNIWTIKNEFKDEESNI